MDGRLTVEEVLGLRTASRVTLSGAWAGGSYAPSADKEVNVLAVTLLGISISGRELLIIGAVVVIIVLVGIVLMQRRPPK
jgi:hypothetical protein